MKNQYRKSLLFFVLLVGVFAGCATDTVPAPGGGERPVDENGKATFLVTGDEEIAPGKDDAISGQRGLPVSVDDAATAVWDVENAWADTDTAAARKAGLAWGENSGLNWDEKYQLWVASLQETASESGYAQTFELTTPWGKSLPAPALECAETAIFLRVAFASWYQLPFFLEARDGRGRVYFGHFGMRREDGKYENMPNFKTRYPDFRSQADAVRNGAPWPSDAALAAKKIPGSFDDQQPMLGPDARAGAYFDEIFLNKRVGHFLVLTLAWFGSVNLADSANTFNLQPEGVRAGDVLLERWQRTGIGHTLVVVRSEPAGTREIDGEVVSQLEVELASGSMPRRQPVWESAGASKRYFLMEETGGEGYADLGGGIKRWRTAKSVGGRWTNVVMPDYAPLWINSNDHEAIAARVERFADVLVELSPEQKRDVLLDVIESKRQHLRQFPASCSARINREDAFDSLYELMETEFGVSRSQVDEQYRTLEDYVFAELEYEKSKTCCWNRSTADMYEIVMDYNVGLQEDASQCVAPVVFMNRDDSGDGYEMFREHAVALGRGAQWQPWSEDESCPQRDVPEDTIAPAEIVEFCALTGGGAVVEPVDTTSVQAAFRGGIDIPDSDLQGARSTATVDATGTIASAVLEVDISHTWRGDLEISLVHPDGTSVLLRRPDGDDGDGVVQQFEVPGFAGKSAAGEYTLVVKDTAAQDTGRLNSAVLTLAVE